MTHALQENNVVILEHPPPPALPNSADLLAHSGALSSASPEPMHDDVTGLSLSLTFDFCLSSSFLESRSLVLATTSAVTSLLPPSAPELGTAEAILKAGPCGDKDNHSLLSGNHAIPENTVVILEQPPLAPIPPSATAITTTGALQQGLDAELTGDPLPHSSHGQFEVV